jgi:hypothetical protein
MAVTSTAMTAAEVVVCTNTVIVADDDAHFRGSKIFGRIAASM